MNNFFNGCFRNDICVVDIQLFMLMRIVCSGFYFVVGRNVIKVNLFLVFVLQILVINIGFDNLIEIIGRYLMYVLVGLVFIGVFDLLIGDKGLV